MGLGMEAVGGKYKDLFAELTEYEKQGIDISIEGSPASPMQIVSAHLLREELVYMRDYITDENGRLTELSFDKIGDSR